MKTSHRAVSLFSNCGAGDTGYRDAGFTFDVAAELEERRLKVCEANLPSVAGIPGDLKKTWSEVVSVYRKRTSKPLDLLTSCPPCQGMSTIRAGMGKGSDPEEGSKDERNLLVEVIADVVRELEPRSIVVENVPAFLTRKVLHPDTDQAISAASLLIERLGSAYKAYPMTADLSNFGIPQSRRRSFLTFLRADEPACELLEEEGLAPYPAPSHADSPVKLEEALRELSPEQLDARHKYESEDPMHVVPYWDDIRYEMVSAIKPGSGMSAWENDHCPDCGLQVEEKEAAQCPACNARLLRPVVEEKDGSLRLVNGFRRSSYRRMDPKRPSPTITTASGRIGASNTIHPFQHRLLSPLECAWLQTFPEDFCWGGEDWHALDWGYGNVRAMIGEAVPPLFTRQHGAVLAGLLAGKVVTQLLPTGDTRCTNAQRKLGL